MRRHVVSVHAWRRTAIMARKRDERLQARARAEAGATAWPPTDEPARQALYERFAGAVTPTSKLEVRKATHSERGRYVVLVVA